MPNHVAVEVVFRNVNAEQQEKIVAAACNSKGEVEFAVLVPPPINYWAGAVGSKHGVFPGDHLDWCSKNWGTKWDAYDHKNTERTSDSITFRFSTAWRAPYGWLVAMFNTLLLSFEYNYLSEGETRGHSGTFDWSKMGTIFGEAWNEGVCTDDMQKHLHMLRWGCESFPEDESEEVATSEG